MNDAFHPPPYTTTLFSFCFAPYSNRLMPFRNLYVQFENLRLTGHTKVTRFELLVAHARTRHVCRTILAYECDKLISNYEEYLCMILVMGCPILWVRSIYVYWMWYRMGDAWLVTEIIEIRPLWQMFKIRLRVFWFIFIEQIYPVKVSWCRKRFNV